MASAKAQEALKHLFDGFERREDHGDTWGESAMVRIEPKDLPVPGLLLFLLTEVMGLVNLGPDEKTAWHVPLAFRGHRVTVASQKFGLRMYVVPADGSSEGAEAIATEVRRRLGKERTAVRSSLHRYAIEHRRQDRPLLGGELLDEHGIAHELAEPVGVEAGSPDVCVPRVAVDVEGLGARFEPSPARRPAASPGPPVSATVPIIASEG